MKLHLIGAALVGSLLLTSCGSDDPETSVDSENAEYFDQLPADIQEAGEITFVGDAQAPNRIVGEDGESLTGVQADFAAALEPLLGVKIEMPIVDGFAAVKTGLESGRYDVAWGGLLSSEDSESTLDIISWTTARPAFVSRSDAPIETIDDLCGKTLARVAGSPAMDANFAILATHCEESGLDPYTDMTLAGRAEVMLAVKTERADGLATAPGDAAYMLKEEPDDWSVMLGDEDVFPTDYLGAAMVKGQDGLRDAMYGAMQDLWADGTYDEIMSEWGLEDVAIDEPLLNQATSGSGG